MAWVETRITRTTQPQDAAQLDLSHPLLIGGQEQGFYTGGTRDAVSNKSHIFYGSNTLAATPKGKGHNNAGSGSIAIPVSAYGGSLSVTFWAGYYNGSGLTNRYLFGDYDGSAGTGLTPRHSNIGNNWGWFNGTAVENSGESLVDGQFYVFVAVRDVAAGAIKVYRNGVLKLTTTQAPAYLTTFAIGSIGANQVALATNCTSLLAGRMRFKSWNSAQVKEFSENVWQIFEPEVTRIWVDDAVSAGGAATVIPIGVQATGSVGTPSATGAATTTPAGVSVSSAVGTPVAVGGASIPATVIPAGVQATAAVGTVSATGAAVAQPAGVTATGAVGAPVAVAGTSIPATVLPAGVQASSAVGTPTVTAAAIAQPLGVAVIAYVGTPTIATGVSGVAVAYPAGVATIGQVGTLIATGAAWTAVVGVQAVGSVGTPFAYEGALISTTAGAQTRPSRLQSSSRASRIQAGSRASR